MHLGCEELQKEQEQLHNLQGLLAGSKMQKAEC